jgi:hypothetical protein
MGAYEWIAVPTHYVSLNSPNPTPPYLSWSTAAANIQDAVNAAAAGDQVLVTNGIYANSVVGTQNQSARVGVFKQISLRSVNGPQFTIIQGGNSTRCVYLKDNNAILSGFTLTNGFLVVEFRLSAGLGGGVYCWGTNAIVSNCVVVGNTADNGGGAYGEQGCKFINCTLTDNAAYSDGGAVAGTRGGGLQSTPGCTLINCTLARNSAEAGGGACGIQPFGRCVLINCMLTNNSANIVGAAAAACGLANCKLTGNYSDGGAVAQCFLTNCTVMYNFYGVKSSTLRNCILYYNGSDGSDQCVLSYCCANTGLPAPGLGNISDEPQVYWDGDTFRLLSNSPCINAGNNAYATGSTDAEGNPRIAGGTVDIGAFEFQSPSSVLSYAWAQQYGLPTDGSADYADADNDGMNNWQEWIAGTIPTDSASALRLLQPVQGVSGVTLTWQSVSNRTYSLERTTSIGAQPSFSPIAGNIVGQAGTTSYVDTNTFSNSVFFYRVRVE